MRDRQICLHMYCKRFGKMVWRRIIERTSIVSRDMQVRKREGLRPKSDLATSKTLR